MAPNSTYGFPFIAPLIAERWVFLPRAPVLADLYFMKISLDPSLDARHQDVPASTVLSNWYDANAAIQRLWAIQPESGEGSPAMRVVVMLAPSPDGNDANLIWMARGPDWERELRQQLAGAVQLEWIDGPLPDEFEIDGEGVVLSLLCWRDATVIQN